MTKFFYDIYTLLRIPLKNVIRSRRRTFITMAGIAIACICLIIFGGYIRVMQDGIMNAAITTEFGHIQIARTGYFSEDATSTKHLVPVEEFSQIEEFVLGLGEVQYVNMRLHLMGMIGNMEDSTYFAGICGRPEFEKMMTPNTVSGEKMSESDPTGIIIGIAMAEKLKAKVGDNLLLFFSSPGGSQEAINASVRGIYKGMLKEQEKVMVYMPLQTAWDLMLEKKAHRLLIFLQDKKDVPKTLATLNSYIQSHHLNLEAKSWDDLATYQKQIINMFKGFLMVAGVIIAIIILFNISNTMYMTITERTREIGSMRAMGDTSGKIIRLLFTEGLLMGVIGAAVGGLAVSGLIPLINSAKITLPPGPGQTDPIPVFIAFDGWTFAIVVICVIFTTALASLPPSIKATRIKIADALRYR